ncbi:hypothetical protein, variant [Cladophialophora immunda]|uniref:SH3 domain-containing protein n=1 Tax=Cladophialophora immunda TaxID=569365 RepID=A0A0D2B853_9EURO|nr:hypothetical protein, variant [Cladophialophora immunda]KIW33817.1 hypothetical protein, variant [Cladophialophora immunda]
MVRAMTTLKPQLVRADTLDLQDHTSPSAKDHSRQPAHPSPYGYGPAAPHQAQTLRHAEQESYQEQHASPRASEDRANSGFQQSDQHFYDDLDDDRDDEHPNAQNATNGAGYHGQDLDDGDGGDSHDEDMDDDLMDKISSSPSIEDEDIDFEFVYALHTFVATVEGQANATKGDTMVLLDDSNSYWWLVRVVKDGSIGYLPAEHIETPTERLARLNKHRNVDLSAQMLGDNPEKSKNPLKKAMRRRNAKTVQFAPPTYYEPSDYEYSDEEEEEGEDGQLDQVGMDNSDDGDNAEDQQEASAASAETQEPRDSTAVNGIQRVTSNDSLKNETASSPVKAQQSQSNSEAKQTDEPVLRSRKGVVRNTDSFFKDDTVETKKISLTPRLLRGDSDSGGSTEQEVRQRPSLETFDKIVGVDDKSKEKKKEKKGMLSGLFKRKKGMPQEESEKVLEDPRQSPGSKDSMESLTIKPETGPERRPSKLQKTPPGMSPKASPTEARHPQQSLGQTPPAPTGPAPEPPTVRRVEPDGQHPDTSVQSQPVQVNRFPSLTEKRTISSPATTALKPTPSISPDSGSPVKPIYTKRAKERFAIDESDSETDDKNITVDDRGRQSVSPAPDLQAQQPRSDSASQVLAPAAVAPGKFGDNRFQAQPPAVSSSSPLPQEPNPSESEGTASTSKPSPSTTTHTPSTSRSTPTWSDASLRSYMENSQDIKDLLIIVHDKSNVMPVGPDHPLMHNLFIDERTKLAEMQSQLDTMLMSWISKKNGTIMPPTT